jgi:AcrR family transcriptional regulator
MVPQPAVHAAAERGFLSVRVSKLARAADVSESTVRRWWRGDEVREDSVDAIERALGIGKRLETRRTRTAR